jgi:hypothetical protein
MSEEAEYPVTDEGPDDDVEIELTDEELGEEGVEVEAPEPEGDEADPEEEEAEASDEEPDEEDPKPKKRSRTDKSVVELRRRAQEAELLAKQLDHQLAQESALRAQSDAAMMTHYEGLLESQARDAKRRLLEAKSLGDSEAEVEAQSELFRIQSDIGNVQSWKAQTARDAKQPPTPRDPQPQPPAQPTVDPNTAQWIKKNEWFQPGSANFDAEMHEEATLYARRVERRYRAEGRADEIGSTSYFREIDKHVREEFPDAFEGQAVPKKGTPRMSGDNRVAPVTRTGQPGQSSKPSTKVKLSVDQRRLAHQMAASGAYMKPNGSRMNNEEAERYHAVFLLKQNRR